MCVLRVKNEYIIVLFVGNNSQTVLEGKAVIVVRIKLVYRFSFLLLFCSFFSLIFKFFFYSFFERYTVISAIYIALLLTVITIILIIGFGSHAYIVRTRGQLLTCISIILYLNCIISSYKPCVSVLVSELLIISFYFYWTSSTYIYRRDTYTGCSMRNITTDYEFFWTIYLPVGY